ncbi:putative MFS-type transporter YcaD [bacterium HR40]|nr:putative MFS-type transporter YcaD [bacterium HR40]
MELALVIATASLVGSTLSLNFPLLSLVLEREGLDPAAIGLNATASGLGVFVVAPMLARILRRIGARGAMMAGILLSAAGMMLLPVWVHFGFWYAIRLLVSCGTALVFIVSEAAINALAPESHRGRILGLYATVFSIGYTAGPLVIAAAGSTGMLPFLISAAFYLAGLVPTLLARGLDRALAAGGSAHGLRHFAGLLGRAPLAFLAIFVFGVVETAQFALLPIWGLALGRAEGTTALMLSVWVAGNILVQYPVGVLADRLPRRLVLAGCALVTTILLSALPLLAQVEPLLWLLLLLLGGVTGAIYTLALVLIGETFRGIDLALANTAFVIMIQLGAALGPGYAGVGMSLFGPHGLPLALACASGILTAAAARRGTGLPVAAAALVDPADPPGPRRRT